MLDYSKYKYEQAQKQKQARKHQQQITVREIKFRPKIAEHDYDTKKHHVERFLRHKDKVKVTIMFRGREVTHPERGTAILDRLAEELSELGVVEQRPMQEGRNMTMMMAPSKAVLPGASTRAPAADAEAADGGRRRQQAAADGARGRRSRARRQRPSGARAPPRRRRRATPRRAPSPPRRAAPSPPRPAGSSAARRRSRCRRRAAAEARGALRACHNRGSIMPKMKTHSGAKKRFKVTARRQGPRPPRLHEPHPREEVAEEEARPRPPGDPLQG